MATQTLAAATRAFPVSIYSDDVPIPYPSTPMVGVVTGFGADRLTAAESNFSSLKAGDIIYNTSGGVADIVVGVNTSTQILLAGYSGGGFAIGDSFSIYPGNRNEGCTLYVCGAGDVEVETVGGDIVTFLGVAGAHEPQLIPVQVLKVRAATSATFIIALW